MTLASDPFATQSGDGALSCLGHDLRAALGEMRIGLSMLDRHEIPPGLKELLAQCRSAGDSLSRLVDQSLLACMGQGSPVTNAPDTVPTAAFLSGLSQRWAGLAAQTGHRFAVVETGELPARFCIDRTALERVMANLVGNALRHTPPCQITLRFTICDCAVLRFSVEDEGPGFPAAHIAALSRDFALPAEARREGGGYGLQSVKLLVGAMGGRCDARNKTEAGNGAVSGAEVSISLPLGPTGAVAGTGESSQRHLPHPTGNAPDLTGIRLLLADDSASCRELVAMIAHQTGATLQIVSDGLATMQALQSGPLPDVAILDDDMPGATGLEVLRWLRAAGGARAKLPVLALTSHIGAARVGAFYDAGASAVLTKPVLSAQELGRAIQQAQGLAKLSVPPAFTVQATDTAALQRLAGLAGPVAAAALFATLAEDLSAASAGLSRAAASADLEAMRAHSHVVIALAGTAGAMGLHDDAGTLNTLIHDQGPLDRITRRALDLVPGIEDLITTIARAAPPCPSGVASWPSQTGVP